MIENIIFALYDEARELDYAYENGEITFTEHEAYKAEMSQFLAIILRGLSGFEQMMLVYEGKRRGYFAGVEL